MEILISTAVIMLALLLTFGMVAGYEKREQRMSPEEERQFYTPEELSRDYPSLSSAEITSDNVQEVINYRLETGLEHPLIQARKADSFAESDGKRVAIESKVSSLEKVHAQTAKIVQEVLAATPGTYHDGDFIFKGGLQ